MVLNSNLCPPVRFIAIFFVGVAVGFAKNRLSALRERSSASLASLSPVDCYAGVTILAAKKCKPPVLLEKIVMKSPKTAYFEVTNAKYSNKPYCSTKVRV